MKLPAPAGNAPAEPAMPPMAPEATAPADDLDFGGETPTEPTPEIPEAPADDKPFDKEPFDAGIDVDEESDPKKFIQKLSGKIGQSLRDYTEKQGQPDFELEKFAINSLISATHTAQMDEEDKNDIIKKINKAGENDSENLGMDDDSNNDNFGDDNGDGDGADFGGNSKNDDEDGLEEVQLFEDGSIFLKEPKKMSIFAPEGSAEFMEENRLDEKKPCWTGYKQVGMKEKNGKEVPNCVPINEGENKSNNYMFWLNLKGIHDDAIEILNMDNSEVDALIADGHQWAFEHLVTSKDDIEEVYHFLEGNLESNKTMMSEDMGESNNYMFWSSLKTIAHASGELLKMDKDAVDNILSNGHGWALDHIATSNDDMEEVYHFLANTLNAYNGDTEGGYEDEYGSVEGGKLYEGKYDGKPLGKPMKGDVKKFKVYVKNAKGNVIKVNFGDPNMEIKRDNPERRKSFRARHKCAQAKDRTTPKYWSCKMWSKTPVSKIVEENLVNSKKYSIFGKNELKSKLQETFNQEIMSEPLIEPIVKPTTKPAEPTPSRRNKPFTIEPDSIPQPDPKALNENLNVKTINVYVPDEIILKKITNIPTFNRVFSTKLTVGDNEMRVNHKQYSDIIRLKDMLSGVEVTDKTKGISENLNKLPVYHNTFSSAVQTAQQYAESKGYTIDENEWFNSVATGPKKPKEGQTNRYSISLYKDGKEQRKALHIQVYGMKNGYELNTYIA